MVECANRLLVPLLREETISSTHAFRRGLDVSIRHRAPCQNYGAYSRLCRISTNDATLIAAFVMSTWFIESLPIAPYLALVGLPRSGKTTLLQVLNLLFRRPLLTADITSAAFYEVYEKLGPTLLVDETLTAGNRRQLFHLLIGYLPPRDAGSSNKSSWSCSDRRDELVELLMVG